MAGIIKNNIKHVAIIMDGNGRWAEGRAHQRIWGHIRGSSVVSNIVEEADQLGVQALTLYAFSTENWSRPKTEIKTLFKLLKKFLIKERKKIIHNQIRFSVIGKIDELPEATINLIKDVEQETKNNIGLKLTFAFGYGGRNELVSAVNNFIKENPGQELNEQDITENLYQPDLGEVDLLIRTGGDQRISNFLLWQVAYAELYFTNSKWPEFKKSEFRNIINTVNQRERRFGNIDLQESLKKNTQLAKDNQKSIGSSNHV
jgi:undecaprenyl diphosphate synthase